MPGAYTEQTVLLLLQEKKEIQAKVKAEKREKRLQSKFGKTANGQKWVYFGMRVSVRCVFTECIVRCILVTCQWTLCLVAE